MGDKSRRSIIKRLMEKKNWCELSGAMGVEGFQPWRRMRPFDTNNIVSADRGKGECFGHQPPETRCPVALLNNDCSRTFLCDGRTVLFEQCAVQLNQQLHRSFRVFLFDNLGFDFAPRARRFRGRVLLWHTLNPLLPRIDLTLSLK
jgi:hypothetical protein